MELIKKEKQEDDPPPTKRIKTISPHAVAMAPPRALETSTEPPKKRLRGYAKGAKAAPPTLQEQLTSINEEINKLELDISSCATEFQKVRLSMLTGILSYEGIQARDKIEQLTSKLGDLRKQREAAISKVDAAIFENIHKRREAEDEAKRKIKEETEGAPPVKKRRHTTVDGEEYEEETEAEIKVCKGGCQHLIYDTSAYVDICEDCGAVYDHRLDCTPEHFSFGDVHFDIIPRRRGGGYKPPNHFAEILAQFQGKRRSCAPLNIVNMIDDYCKRYHIKTHKITPLVVRQILKQKQQEETAVFKWAKKKPEKGFTKYTDYYKHTPEIAWRLSGIPPPYMTPSQQDKIIALFPLAVAAYRNSPRYQTRKANRNGRKKEEPNVLNYFYMLYKLCQMVGYEEFLPYIPLPKSLANIEDCDQNGWKFVCKENHWQYIPTR